MPRIRSLVWTLTSLCFGCMAQVDEPVGEELALADEAVELDQSVQGLIGPNDVGVIQPEGMNCPNEHIMLTLENEYTNNNWNEIDGWIGATEQPNSVTKWHFCRVDGRNFGRVRSNNSAHNYAVLKLGNTCPAGSVEFNRHFDNEDRPSGCPPWPLACGVGKPPTQGNYAPNHYNGNNLDMKFCMFRASPTAGVTLPLAFLGMPYGVFATPDLPGALDSGYVHTDDEDDNNWNSLTGDFAGSQLFLEADGATTLHVAKVFPQLIWLPLPIFDTL
jgi:hypothetical protein